jgi:hypothetical protein
MTSAAGLQSLTAIVVTDATLQRRLLATTSRDEFVALVVTIAGERGLQLDASDVHAELAARRRAHLERWV